MNDRRADEPSHIAPLALWIVIQLAALTIGATRVPLWARFDRPTEDLALAILLSVQIAASAMLAPVVGNGGVRAALIALSNLPFAFLAAALSAVSATGVIRAETYVACWIALIAIWITTFPRQCAFTTAVFSAIAIGGVVFDYLRNEYGVPSSLSFAPIQSAIGLSDPSTSPWARLVLIGGAWIVSALTALLIARQLIHNRNQQIVDNSVEDRT